MASGPDPILKALEDLTKAMSDLAKAPSSGGGGRAAGMKKGKTEYENIHGVMVESGEEGHSPEQKLAAHYLGRISKGLGGKVGSLLGPEAGAIGSSIGAEAGVTAGLGQVGAPIAIILAAAGALVVFTRAVIDASKAQQQHNFQYANSSAAMAAVQIQSEMADAFRDRDIGDRTAGTAAALAQSNTGYDNTVAEFEILWSNIKNIGLAAAMEVITNLLKPVAAVAGEISEWLDLEGGEKPEDVAGFFDRTAKQVEEARKKGGADWLRRFP